MVPCSRSRITAAATSTIDRMVMKLMIAITEVKRIESRLGLKKARVVTLIGNSASMPRLCSQVRHLVQHDLLDVERADAGLGHGGGVDQDLHRRLQAAQHVGLERGRDVETKVMRPRFHGRVDLIAVEQHRRLEQRRLQRAGDAAGQLRMVGIDDADRGVDHLGRDAVGDGVDRAGERRRTSSTSMTRSWRRLASSFRPSVQTLASARIRSPASSGTARAATRKPMANSASTTRSRMKAEAGRPLVKVPRLIVLEPGEPESRCRDSLRRAGQRRGRDREARRN